MHRDDAKNERELRWKMAMIAGMACLVQPAVSAPAGAQAVNYSRDPSTVIASYRLEPGEIADAESGLSVQIHGDGRVSVHVPRYRKDSGDFTAQLSQAELDGMMAALVANGLMEFDAAAVKQAIRDARLNRGGGASAVLAESTDPSVTTIELRVRRNSTSGGGTGGGAAEIAKTVRWVGLENDAREFSDVAAIRKLAAASQRLEAVTQRPDLQRVQ